jgi:hypothetical protein
MDVELFLSHPQMPYCSPIVPSVFVNGAPRALIVQTKSNQSQGREATLLKVLLSCLMSRYRWEGQCLHYKDLGVLFDKKLTNHCQLSCQLGDPDSVT